MWRSQFLKFFNLFKLTTKHTKHGQSDCVLWRFLDHFKCMILPPFQSWIRYCLDLLQSLSLLLAAASLILFHCFSMCFFSKSWWSTAVACIPPISANALHLISAEKWEIFMASHTMLFFRFFRTSMLALCPTPVSENWCHGPTTVGGTSALIAKQNCSLSLQMQWSAIQIRIYMSKLWQAWELCLLRRWLVVQSSRGILFFWLASWAAEGEPSHMECRGWGPSSSSVNSIETHHAGPRK